MTCETTAYLHTTCTAVSTRLCTSQTGTACVMLCVCKARFQLSVDDAAIKKLKHTTPNLHGMQMRHSKRQMSGVHRIHRCAHGASDFKVGWPSVGILLPGSWHGAILRRHHNHSAECETCKLYEQATRKSASVLHVALLQ